MHGEETITPQAKVMHSWCHCPYFVRYIVFGFYKKRTLVFSLCMKETTFNNE
jgi:hypothetical protein